MNFKKIDHIFSLKAKISVLVSISHAFFDFVILLVPISLNLIAFYGFKEYAQFIVQLIVFLNGIYIFYQAYVFKYSLSKCMIKRPLQN